MNIPSSDPVVLSRSRAVQCDLPKPAGRLGGHTRALRAIAPASASSHPPSEWSICSTRSRHAERLSPLRETRLGRAAGTRQGAPPVCNPALFWLQIGTVNRAQTRGAVHVGGIAGHEPGLARRLSLSGRKLITFCVWRPRCRYPCPQRREARGELGSRRTIKRRPRSRLRRP